MLAGKEHIHHKKPRTKKTRAYSLIHEGSWTKARIAVSGGADPNTSLSS